LSTCDNPAHPAASSDPVVEAGGQKEAAELFKERYADLDYGKEHQLTHPLGRPARSPYKSRDGGNLSEEDSSGSEGESNGRSIVPDFSATLISPQYFPHTMLLCVCPHTRTTAWGL